MDYSAVRNAIYANSKKTLVNCEVKFDDFGDFIPFTASPDDSEAHGRQIYKECKSGEWGAVSAYVAPVINWIAIAEEQRQQRLSESYSVTADWRTELGLGVLDDDDKARLVEWMAYIRNLKKLDLSAVTSEKKYNAQVWPEVPEHVA